ncbi:SMP-30/gluconolactonase/LRE family protein [Paenibacillus sp. GCM10027626]|uniref:SMP-30/gluconolactonase/LRE family protein n=1 Tax=Paenibacillus sp. GCM10027626 TaxID=3273411 RepID=UPI003628079A
MTILKPITPAAVQAPGSTLGEGPCWDSRTNHMYWVDIEGARIHRYSPATGETDTYEAPEKISALIPCAQGGWVATAYHALYHWNTGDETFEEILRFKLPDNVRFNDGKAGPDGALWIGTMDMSSGQPIGSLYRVDEQLQVEEKVTGIYCSNGLDWSPDNSEMYYIDSGVKEVRAYAFDLATGSLGERRTAVQLPEEGSGVPDGMSLDEEGMIWVAEWGGHRVARWNPHNGELLAAVQLPVPQPSSCAFGGEHYNMLFMTSAAAGLPAEQRSRYPLSGALFQAVDGLKVHGRPPFQYAWRK